MSVIENPRVIDCQYLYPQVACSYLLTDDSGKQAAIIETNTAHAVPHILKAVKESNVTLEDVRYIIVTHVHLDHAGGASTLLKHCPNAVIVAHPRAARHLIDPSRLVMSSKAVYGEETFAKLYGEIAAAPGDKVISPEDNTSLPFGNSKLHFVYTRGHANHHFVVFDEHTRTVFTGDSFGLAYPLLQKGSYPFLFASSTPTDFDAPAAIESVHKITALGAEKAGLTHFGFWNDMKEGKKQMLASLEKLTEIYNLVESNTGDDDEVTGYCRDLMEKYIFREVVNRNISLGVQEKEALAMDIELNSQGLVFPILRARRKAAL